MRLLQFGNHKKRDIERLLSQGLSEVSFRNLWSHLKTCTDCRAYYEQERQIENVLFSTNALNVAAIERLASAVVPSPSISSAWKEWRWVAALAPMVASLLVMVAVQRTPPVVRHQESDFAARGGLSTDLRAGLSAFLIEPETRQVERLGRHAAEIPVNPQQIVQFAYRNRDFQFVEVFGVDGNFQIHWRPDSTEKDGGVALRRDVQDEPLSSAWQMPMSGRLRVFGIFSNAPIERAKIQKAVQVLQSDKIALKDATRLPGLDAYQDSMLFEVAPRVP